jgi:hypothetical protein
MHFHLLSTLELQVNQSPWCAFAMAIGLAKVAEKRGKLLRRRSMPE